LDVCSIVRVVGVLRGENRFWGARSR
jgi:hypothetical protein